MRTYFYDIESLDNVFTLANFRLQDNTIEIYYLVDDPALICPNFMRLTMERIYKNNKNFNGPVELYDLRDPESNYRLARIFGLSDAKYANDPNRRSSYPSDFRLVCDTDPDYDEDKHPYLLGYNSQNYDTTMLTLYLYDAISERTGKFVPVVTAQKMRVYNDQLFTRFNKSMSDRLKYSIRMKQRGGQNIPEWVGPDYKLPPFAIRKNMLMSGRHLDVARLNEKQSKVGLKRILGMEGYQILESDKLRPGQDHIEDADQLLDLMAYNVSDVVNLAKLFAHKTYTSGFRLKKQLLKTYPELVYSEALDEDGNGLYKPCISPQTVRSDRMLIDSPSAQLATKALCPYGHLHDYDTVSYLYPSEAKAKEFGIPRVNVLEEARKFFYANFQQPELRARFDEIYGYYKAIEGRNFNASENYLVDHGIDPDSSPEPQLLLPPELKVAKFTEMPEINTCMYYYNKDGTPSSCFVNFSTGGIHGAEYNKRLWESDLKKYEEAMAAHRAKLDVFRRVKAMYPDPRDLKAAKGVEIDGVKYRPSTFLKPKATKLVAFYKDEDSFPEPKAPVLFSSSRSERTGAITYNLVKRYAYTSAGPTNHEDFTSYYPNMLRMMDAFFNPGLGYDRYGEIFDDKTRFGKLMKDKSLPAEQRELYDVMRDGTKLILNSASGAADAGFESNIRMNNKIISMRIIGQLFTWRIGQAQTIEGASIISTNTDGLYSVMEPVRNNEILARESADIHVDIEPEPIFLISKDSNNRAEIEMDGNQLTEVAGASGSSLSCRKGPTPTQSLAHPAILDWAMTEYLILASIGYKGLSLETPFDDAIGMSILSSARKVFDDDVKTMRMFQNVIAASPGSQRFIFATTDEKPDEPIPLQHYNRCFITKDGTPGTIHMKAAHAKVITAAMLKKRKADNERMQQHDPIAAAILSVNGVKTSEMPPTKEATVVKIAGVEEQWYMLVNNSDLHLMPQDEIDTLLDSLDYDKYLMLFRDSFMKNWFNMTPEYEAAMAEAALKEKQTAKTPAELFSQDQDNTANTGAATDNANDTQAEAMSDTPPAAPDTQSDVPPETETPDVSELPQSDTGMSSMPPQDAANNTQTSSDTVQPEPEPPDTEIPQEVSEQEAAMLLKRANGTPDFMDGLNLPRMIQIQKTLLTMEDIKKGEHQLCMGGIREIDAHRVLAKLMKAMTDTNIDD